jgi:hypothetical protein
MTPFTAPGAPTAPAPSSEPRTGFGTNESVAITQQWLINRRNEGATPDEICRELVASGWDVDTAASCSLKSLRRSDVHRGMYSGLCWGAGLAALGAGSAAHLALISSRDPIELATFITLMLVAAPIGVACGIRARTIEAAEPHAIWSPTRRALFGTLAATTAAVGIIRLLHYTFNAVAAAVGASGFEFTPSTVVQVMVTLSIAAPLFWWSLTEWRRSNVALRSLTAKRTPAS